MNKLCKTCKHARTLIEMAFLCIRSAVRWPPVENSVKQPVYGGTSLHSPWGITGIFGGKTPYTARTFCERNGKRIIKPTSGSPAREQTDGCSVFNCKCVIKILSRSGID
jgi:hypothetical protein